MNKSVFKLITGIVAVGTVCAFATHNTKKHVSEVNQSEKDDITASDNINTNREYASAVYTLLLLCLCVLILTIYVVIRFIRGL